MFNKWKKKYIEIGIEKGKEIGIDEGKRIGEENSYKKAMDYANLYIEEYVNAFNQEFQRQTTQNALDYKGNTPKQQEFILDDTMLQWVKSIIEIRNTQFFKTTYFDLINSAKIQEFINYVDYLEHTNEIKLQCPQTHYYLPEVKKALKDAYQNKLLVEEAEKTLKLSTHEGQNIR